MNKQLTKKTIGIAASAALMASVALSGSALGAPANPPGKDKPKRNDNIENGDRTSISVYQTCAIVEDDLVVNVLITDNNADTCDVNGENCTKAQAELESVEVQGLGKIGPEYFTYGSPWGSNISACASDPLPGDGLCIDHDDIEIPDTATLNDTCDDLNSIEIGTTCTITLEGLCGASADGAKALNALTTIDTGTNGNRVEYYAQCVDSYLKVDGQCD